VEEAQPKSAGAIELRSRLLAKQGKPQEAADLLVTLLDAAPDEKSRLQMMAGVVALLEEFKQLVAAETILRKAISEHPQAKMALAAFLGRHGDLNETFEMLEQSRKSYPLSMIVQAGLEVLRRRSSEADKQQYETISAWLKSALADEPESLALRLQQAELKDIQGRPTEVISAYREMLNDKKLDPKQRAIIQNNLAFVLAMNGDSGNTAEALRLIDEAIAILGPSSDLLDTRAICYLQQGDNKQAIKDLQVAIIDSPSPVKYIHLAMAEAKAGDKAAARKSLDRARELKFEVNELSAKERQNFEKISREIEGK
jgi:tetratricopeptide (TPR) repeat protein